MSTRAYPLPRPESGNDPRFTMGLFLDIGKALEAAGYPPITAGGDFVELWLTLFRFIYDPEVIPSPAADPAEVDDRLDEDQPTPPARGHGQDGVDTPAVPDNSPLTLAECRSALSYWERKASEAQAAGLRGEFDRRMAGVVTLWKSIRRLEDNASGYTDAQLDWVACSVCGVKFADDEITAQGPPAPDGRFLRAHPDCLTESTFTEPPGVAP